MSVLLVCGESGSESPTIFDQLIAGGLSPAKLSKHEHYAPAQISQEICRANGIDILDPRQVRQLAPGRVWQALATDLMLANLRERNWGWEDRNLIYLLDFWRDFDPLVKFVLVYSSPQQAVARAIEAGDASPELVQQTLAMWQAFNTALLRFHARHRERSLLVNSHTVAKDVNHLVGLARDRLGCGLEDQPVTTYSQQQPNGIADLLANELVEDVHEAHDLFQELESTADLPGAQALNGVKARVYKAWDGYRGLIKTGETANDVLTALRAERDGIAAQLEALAGESAGVSSKLAETATALEAERRNAEQLKKGAEQLQASLAAIEAKGAEESRQLQAERKRYDSDIKSLKEQLAATQKKLSGRDADIARANGTNGKVEELTRENELLLMQLHQVQEELETYFLKYQEATKGKEAKPAPEPAKAAPQPEQKKPESAATQALIDLRHFIDGDNWWHAEHDGRWAGPGTKSTLRLPKLAKGSYRLELDIVDAMSPEILREMELRLDSQTLKLKGLGGRAGLIAPFVGARSKKIRYPLTLTSDVRITAADSGQVLEFRFPKTISPASRGSDDTRELAIRLRQVRLEKR